MKFRPNVTQPHLIVKPCRKCKKPTKALLNGQIQLSPTCEPCKKEEEKIFALAQLAANRQARVRAHTTGKKSNPRKER